jgi:hypothetical protein
MDRWEKEHVLVVLQVKKDIIGLRHNVKTLAGARGRKTEGIIGIDRRQSRVAVEAGG